MSSNALKKIALIAMVLDHIALFLPGMPLYLRWIGRISMPLFLFVFVHSIDNTKDRKAFAGRLYIFNALMAFLDLAYNIMPIPSERYYGIFVRLDTNIFGTFFALYVLILVIKKTIARSAHWKKILAAYIFWQAATVVFCTFVSIQLDDAYCLFFAAIIGNIFFNEGRFFVIALGIALYFSKNQKWKCASWYSAVVLGNSVIILSQIIPRIYMHLSSNLLADFIYCRIFGTLGYDVLRFEPPNFLTNEFEWMAMSALPLFLLYDGSKGRPHKYFYYVFYPCHIMAFALLGQFL